MTSEERNALLRQLLEEDDQFRALYDEHQSSEQRLEELSQKSLLSQDDEAEEKRIKLHKLALKDRMELLLTSRRAETVPA